MASPSDVAKTDGFLRFGTRVFNFRIPICRPSVDFAASFKSSIGAPEAASFVTVLTQTRIDMIHIIYNTSGIYDQKLKAVETYLLLAWKLADLFASQKLQLDKDLCFEWRGAITDKPDCSKSSDIIFELLLLLHTKVMLFFIEIGSC